MEVLELLLLIFLKISWTSAGNILILHPMYAGSHVLTLRSLAKSLANEGHSVHIIRWRDNHKYPDILTPNVTEQVLAVNNTDSSSPMFTVEERSRFIMPVEAMWTKGSTMSEIPFNPLFLAVKSFCSSLLQNSDLHLKLRHEQYDVAIVDLIYNECSLALAHHLNLPVVGYWAFIFSGGEPQYTTAQTLPSVTPMIMSHYTDSMNLYQRLVNHLMSILCHFIMQVQFYVTANEIRHYMPDCPHPDVLLSNLSGVLINSHPAVDYPRQLPPSFIEVGGLQINNEITELPSDISRFLDESVDGAVLFTMGFIFDFKYVPNSVVQQYMGAFARLKQRVLVKAVGRPTVKIPDNVKITPWLPQQDVLGHKKVVAFVTHCGMHGVMEALYHGVPMVGVPVFSDQEDVLVRLVERGVAVGVSKSADQRVIQESISEVINNPKYRRNAEQLSRVIRDSNSSPIEKAKWLVNHVINTRGADHLKMSSRHLNLLQIYGIDIVIIFLVFIICMSKLLKSLVPFTALRISNIFIQYQNKCKDD